LHRAGLIYGDKVLGFQGRGKFLEKEREREIDAFCKKINRFQLNHKDMNTCEQENTGVFEMIVGVLTTCHTQYT